MNETNEEEIIDCTSGDQTPEAVFAKPSKSADPDGEDADEGTGGEGETAGSDGRTKTRLALVRRVAVGICDAPQGADGVGELTRTAYANLLAAPWTESEDAPSVPVHDYDRALPAGDAFKAVFGYDGKARTEQGSAGAVCYSYKVPADALTGEACNVSRVSVRVIGDRYLDQGAVLRVYVSPSATPPPVSAFLSLAVSSDPICATCGQTDASGETLAPNKRTGDAVDVSLDLDAPAGAYVHVGLFLADYIGHRGAWIEGGAMLSPATLAVAFSRTVADDTDGGTPSGAVDSFPLDIGVYPPSADLSKIVADEPAVSIRSTYALRTTEANLKQLADASFESRVRNLLSLAQALPAFHSARDGCRFAHGLTAKLAVESDGLKACALSFHGPTGKRTFSGLRFSSPLDAGIPFRLIVFGIPGPQLLQGDTAASGTAIPSYQTIFDKGFLDGTATALQTVKGTFAATGIGGNFSEEQSAGSVSGQTLAALDVPDGKLARVDFDKPFEAGWFSSVLLALVPNGIPLRGETSGTSVSLSLSIGTQLHGTAHTQASNDYKKYSFVETPPFIDVWGSFNVSFTATVDGVEYKGYRSGISVPSHTAPATFDGKYYTPQYGYPSQRAVVTVSFPAFSGSVEMESASGATIRVSYEVAAFKATRFQWAQSEFSFGTFEWNDANISKTATGTRAVAYASATIDPGTVILESPIDK